MISEFRKGQAPVMGAKIKICGLRSEEDIEIVNRYLPDFAGFILCRRFWRYVSPEDLRRLSERTDDRIRKVGVFVDNPVSEIVPCVEEGLIDIVQLHGSEDEDYIRSLRRKTRAPIIKAFQIRSAEDIRAAARSSADWVLLDSGRGSGRTFDWKLIRDIGRDFFLAGGLNPDNVAQAVLNFRPYAVDISSGVETDRHKDAEKVRRCIETVRMR